MADVGMNMLRRERCATKALREPHVAILPSALTTDEEEALNPGAHQGYGIDDVFDALAQSLAEAIGAPAALSSRCSLSRSGRSANYVAQQRGYGKFGSIELAAGASHS